MPSAVGKGLFDLTPTEDEQTLVDVVTRFAAEVVRPAAAEANDACAAPGEVLESSLQIGLPLLGVPEGLGGVSAERSAMAGTLVAEALGKGDMGLAVACLALGAVSTALSLWGSEEQQATYLPAYTGEAVPAAALALTEPRPLFDATTPETTARRDTGGLAYAECLRLSRLAWCALTVGAGQAVLDYVVPYVNERQAFGEPISHRQSVAFMVADIGIELQSMRLVTYKAAFRAAPGQAVRPRGRPGPQAAPSAACRSATTGFSCSAATATSRNTRSSGGTATCVPSR